MLCKKNVFTNFFTAWGREKRGERKEERGNVEFRIVSWY